MFPNGPEFWAASSCINFSATILGCEVDSHIVSFFFCVCLTYSSPLKFCYIYTHFMFFWFLAEPPPYIKIWFSQLYDSLHGGRIPKDSWCKVPYQLFGLVMNICLYILLDSKVLYGLKTPTLPLLTLGFSNFVKRLSLFGFLLTNHFLSGYEIDNKFMSSRSCCIVTDPILLFF